MTKDDHISPESQVADAISATVRDYYEGWFEADPQRMRRALHPDLVKRSLADTTGAINTATLTDMVEATGQGAGTRHAPDRRSISISINHVHDAIADVHVTGEVYVDYLQLVRVDGQWQILNALWAPAVAHTPDAGA